MLRFVLEKIRNKKWLIFSLLIGNLLLVAAAAASPMYTKAALQRMLTRTMSDYVQENHQYPSMVNLYSNASPSGGDERETDTALVANLSDTLGVEPTTVVYNRYIMDIKMRPELARPNDQELPMSVGAMTGLPDHVNIAAGSIYADMPDSEGVIDAVVSEKCMLEQRLMLGEILAAEKLETTFGSPLRVRIVGVIRADESDGQYWYRPPNYYKAQLFVSESAFDAVIPQSVLDRGEHRVWCWIFDYNDLTVDNCGKIAEVSKALTEQFSAKTLHSYRDSFSSLIDQYQVDAARVGATLRILQVPIYVLLAAFLFIVSRQMLEIEAAEIAVIKSRGASGQQIIGVYALQSALLAGVSLVLGIPLAILLCQLIGSANAFLEFVSRSALRLELTGESLLYALAATVVSIGAMVLPVLRYSRTTIVSTKQKKARRGNAPLWQKFCLDGILIAISLYGLYSFHGQEQQITERVRSGSGLDPLLYLSSSLFIVGCGLLTLRIIPLIVRLIYRIGSRRWSPSLYASFLWVMRSRGGGYIMTFLVVTIALGIFNASVARTVNSNETDRIVYCDGGADMMILENWRDNSAQLGEGSGSVLATPSIGPSASSESSAEDVVYVEPDFTRYSTIPGVLSTARVFYDENAGATLAGTRRSDTVTLMGVSTKEFGETAILKEGLLPEHFYTCLNAISQRSDAVLVSSHFRDKYGFALGDTVTYRSSDGRSARGVIYGFVDYWPAYRAVTTLKESDGQIRETDNLLIVANLGYLQAQWGVMPYQVWLRMKGGDTAPVYDFIREQNISVKQFRDQTADLVAMKNDPGIQGTNGILTVGFAVALVLCTVGFLIYWILAIRNRSLQFGVFRAMGMNMKEIVVMLLNEQLYVSGLSIAAGTGTGMLASRLFVPLIQLAYANAETPLPLEVSLAGSDVLRLLIVVLLVMAVCMVILGAIIRGMKIDQALKLGED